MICVDASVGAKLVLDEERSEQAVALVAAASETGELLVAPPLLPIEVTNILRRRMVREALPQAEAEHLLVRFLAYPIALLAPPEIHRQALALATTYGFGAVYDAHYLALAQLTGAAFWTDDRRLVQTVERSLPFVHWLGTYPVSLTAEPTV